MKLFIIRYTDTKGDNQVAEIQAGTEAMACKKLRKRFNVADIYSIQRALEHVTNID